MKTIRLPIQLALLSTCMLFSLSSLACTDLLWEGAETGGATSTGDWLTDSFARVSGLCSMQVAGLGQVHDATPLDEAEMHGRFMFLPKTLTGTPAEVVIFETFSNNDGSSSVFTISYDGVDFIMRSGAAVATTPAVTDFWNMVAFSFDNAGNSNLWVSSDRTFDIDSELLTPHATISTNGAGVINSVILGTPNGLDTFTGTAQFDDYISTREAQPGMPALIGDGNNDGNIDSLDFLNVIDEIFKTDQGLGQPDCNLDGAVDSLDFLCIIDVIFAGA